jgi:phospholipid/cholesterol/gamma-HCH transport system substrate-binding protein
LRFEERAEVSTQIGRIAAVAALAVAAVVVVILLLGGSGSYQVTARFENASQLVGGEQVVVGGTPVGKVQDIKLGSQGEALVAFTVEDTYAPLEQGTTATIRSYSLSGIANRQVQLTLPPDGEQSAQIPDGGEMDQSDTVSEVDLDQIFNTLNPRTVRNLKKVIRGFEASYDGVGPQANRGFHYLNPFLSTSRRVFSELTLDEHTFERLIVDTSELSGALASRAPDISLLVHNLNGMMGALGRQKESLARAVGQLPDFMREFNTTAVNLRATLDDLDPLVNASKPVAIKLRPFFHQFRLASADLVPTVRDLDAILKRKGKANDLVELTKLQVPLARIGVGPVNRNGEQRQGALPESAQALEGGLPQLSFLRAYTPELLGWFDDFGHSGVYDANGGVGRFSTLFNAFSLSLPSPTPPNVIPFFTAAPVNPLSQPGFTTNQNERCPGSNERNPGDNSTPFTDNGTLDCDPSQVPTGP